jgi:dTMP kinase
VARLPLFIAFEGIDGSGTSTQCQILCDRLRSQGHDLVETREPGGTERAERIRSLVLDPDLDGLDDVAELLLIGASRRQHVCELIEPALESGKPVISDRYAASSCAYQGAGRGLGAQAVATVNDLATAGRWPDLTICLDLPVSEADRRRRHRGAVDDRIEAAGAAFQERVRSAYLALAERDRDQWLVLDAVPAVDEVAAQIEVEIGVRYPEFPFRVTELV